MQEVQRTIIGVAVLSGILLFAFLVSDITPHTPSASHAGYFQDKVIALGIERVGHPIEGFDEALLLMAFPSLMKSDFEGVATFEGHYEVQGGAIVFIRDTGTSISSAERTVSEEGYEVLLSNVAKRLGVALADERDVDALISVISKGYRETQTFETHIDESVSALGVTIIPLEVIEDSRCPIDVVCIQAGTVRVNVLLASGLGESTMVLELGQLVTTEAETITLIDVAPAPISTHTIAPSEYSFRFEVTKR